VIAGEGWFLDRIIVRVHVPQCSKRYVFPCSRFVTAAAAAAAAEEEEGYLFANGITYKSN